MESLFIALSIPIFFVLIAVEALVSARRRSRSYRFGDSINNLSCGIGSQIFGVLFKGVTVGGLIFLSETAAVWSIPADSVVAWGVLIFAVDLCYYAFHRAAHRVGFLWAGHGVHHQSEEYNLSVALRQSWFVGFFSWWFYVPLVLVGFEVWMLLTVRTFNTLYQFWIHTREIKRMGPLEWVLNTPSHHRVHHGINPRYIDKNYAGMFIIWDRLFGTFVPEDDEPVYGTVKPLRSWNPLWANVAIWFDMATVARRTARWRDKLKVWFMPPEWRPEDLGGPVVIPEVTDATRPRFRLRHRGWVTPYIVANFAVIAAAIMAYLALQNQLTASEVFALAGVVLLTLMVWGGLLESGEWALPVEAVRVVLLGAGLAWTWPLL